MCGNRLNWAACRAAVAVVALYALVLQGLLGGMAVGRSLDTAHILCLTDARFSQDGPVKAPPIHSQMSCCTAAHIAPSLDVPVLAASPIIWPFRHTARTSWRPEVVTRPRAPPGISASARAPPVV
ncbi:hypothetical protein FV220_11125 [Methylobacterium sp. WL19]|nr:hypothetical protein FV220_11125 [Methylobacterium sp. WL19]